MNAEACQCQHTDQNDTAKNTAENLEASVFLGFFRLFWLLILIILVVPAVGFVLFGVGIIVGWAAVSLLSIGALIRVMALGVLVRAVRIFAAIAVVWLALTLREDPAAVIISIGSWVGVKVLIRIVLRIGVVTAVSVGILC
ncbi:MAG: hypothetical protein IJ411_00815, partial [Oscillospiraceae bacterium]|nr:hypothetical protein [Oscillospiraceae bacterium]